MDTFTARERKHLPPSPCKKLFFAGLVISYPQEEERAVIQSPQSHICFCFTLSFTAPLTMYQHSRGPGTHTGTADSSSENKSLLEEDRVCRPDS